MKVFVATESLDEGDDFAYTVPGELGRGGPVSQIETANSGRWTSLSGADNPGFVVAAD